ncbi:sigma-70 family RNA polymerase sigma factor [Gorillibacterium massiliense]|uniref:sigma-70 family RNA polymerase sigma factor n=1 Tax=Gorillibacterium massiliense TaxID=1280390 RepID=UPI0004BB531E|nr:sigma-70 family RNA polymerase sigma factor [Gorillibacterium massiliense]
MRQWVEAVKPAQSGDAEAFGELVRHFRGMAFRLAYEKAGDVHLAEDAVQEAFTEAYLHLGKLNEPLAFPGWLKTIVARQISRMLRSKEEGRSPLPLMETARGFADMTDVVDVIMRKEGERALWDSVAALSETLRVPMQLFYRYGYSLAEISNDLGIPVPTLKKRLFDARRKLRTALPISDLASMFNHLVEEGVRMLHIVNGDQVGNLLKQGIVKGDVLVWREIYSVGPVFETLSGEKERQVRAQDLERTLGIPADTYISGCIRQEETLADIQRYEEVVLWFEHDLFDQSMLAYLLHELSKRKLESTKLSLLCIGEFPGIELFHGLGQLSAQQLSTLTGTWRTIGRREMELGNELWRAYASSDPLRLWNLLELKKEAIASSANPFAYEAFKAHLSRLPSIRNGLGVVEQATLEAVRSGTETPLELFRQVTDTLPVLGMGDLEFWMYLWALAQSPQPLLIINGVEPGADFRQVSGFLQRRVQLTAIGEQILDGSADRVALQGIDQWYGGLHLHGREVPWRWDSAAGEPVRV